MYALSWVHSLVVRTIIIPIAHSIENHGRKVRASGFNGLPIMPTGIEAFVFAKFDVFQVVGQRVGKLDLQLL